MGLGIGAGNAVGIDLHNVIPIAGVGNGVQYADIGGNAANQQLFRCQTRQPVGQRGIEKPAIPLFGDNVRLSAIIRGHEIGQFGMTSVSAVPMTQCTGNT